jgi:hypothetical protein
MTKREHDGARMMQNPVFWFVAASLFVPSVAFPQSLGLDPSCSQEFRSAESFCGPNTVATRNRCLSEGLPPDCAAHLNAGTVSKADADCRQKLQQQLLLCLQTTQSATQKCLYDRVSAKCREQMNTAQRRGQEILKSCQEAQQRLCGGMESTEKLLQCNEAHRTELTAACNPR